MAVQLSSFNKTLTDTDVNRGLVITNSMYKDFLNRYLKPDDQARGKMNCTFPINAVCVDHNPPHIAVLKIKVSPREAEGRTDRKFVKGPWVDYLVRCGIKEGDTLRFEWDVGSYRLTIHKVLIGEDIDRNLPLEEAEGSGAADRIDIDAESTLKTMKMLADVLYHHSSNTEEPIDLSTDEIERTIHRLQELHSKEVSKRANLQS